MDIKRILLGKKNKANSIKNSKKVPYKDAESDSESASEIGSFENASEDEEGLHDEFEIEDESVQTNLIDSVNKAVGPTRKRQGQRKDEIEEPYSSINPSLLFTSDGVQQGLSDEQLLSAFGDNLVEKKKIKSLLEPSKSKAKSKQKANAKGKKKREEESTNLSLTTSLKKPVVQKIQRTILYDHVSKDVNKWNSIVYNNRVSEQLFFPLESEEKQPKHVVLKDDSFVPETPLEEKITRILHGDDYAQKKKLEVYGSKEEETQDQIYVRTISDALQKHDELAKLRALQSYEMAKAKRRNKIKSKKYHRILKREKIRKQLKEFEELQKKDPESALEKLDELERARITERMNLKHRNTSKWAKTQLSRAKYDRDSRQAISEQLEISRALTNKVAEDASSGSENETDVDDLDLELPALVKGSMDNPWLLDEGAKDNEKLRLYYTGYKKLHEDINERRQRELKRQEKEAEIQRRQKQEEEDKMKSSQKNELEQDDKETTTNGTKLPKKKKKLIKKKKQKVAKSDESIPSDLLPSDREITADDIDNLFYFADEKLTASVKRKLEELNSSATVKKTKNKKQKVGNRFRNRDGDFDEIRDLRVDDEEINIEGMHTQSGDEEQPLPVAVAQPAKKVKKKNNELIINPSNFLHLKNKKSKIDLKNLNEEILDMDSENESLELDEDEKQRQIIAEAFEDDDVFVEFSEKKATEIESSKPKDIDLNLPGWGSWAGADLPFKPKPQFIKKAPPSKPRTDSDLPHVILNQSANETIRKHQVRSLPFPFTRVKDYEKSIRAPIGRTWLPEKGMKDLIAPKIITQLGSVIQPISEEVLLRKKKSNKNSNYKIKLAGVRNRDMLKEDTIVF